MLMICGLALHISPYLTLQEIYFNVYLRNLKGMNAKPVVRGVKRNAGL